jgi:integrase/recombinase XerD
MPETNRTPVRTKAKQIATTLTKENPDYNYLRELFRHLRKELKVSVPKKESCTQKVTPISIEDLSKFCSILHQDSNQQNQIIIKTLLYTGIRVSELINISIEDIDFEKCQILVQKGIRGQKRIVLFPTAFKENIESHATQMSNKGACYLFESRWKKPYTDRGIRKIMGIYSKKAGLKNNISPNTLRKFFLTWLKQQGIEDKMIQPYSGLVSRQSLEKYDVNAENDMKSIKSKYEDAIQKLLV